MRIVQFINVSGTKTTCSPKNLQQHLLTEKNLNSSFSNLRGSHFATLYLPPNLIPQLTYDDQIILCHLLNKGSLEHS
jgi:hypothetical protein